MPCNHGPLLAEPLVELHQVFVLLQCPLFFDNFGVQVIVVTLSTLFTGPAWQLRRDKIPAFGTMHLYQVKQLLILLLGPGSFLAALDLVLLLERYFAKVLRHRLTDQGK